MIAVGLTGSVGMGKSTAAKMFAELGICVHDADAVVHELYEGKAVDQVGAAFPGAIVDGTVDRARLAEAVFDDPAALRRLEAIVHPLVREAENEFLRGARRRGEAMVVIDIPLLFETGEERRFDAIVVVTASPAEQRRRVLARPGMTAEKFDRILTRQMPDAEKRRRADFIIDTEGGFDSVRRQVRAIVAQLRDKHKNPVK